MTERCLVPALALVIAAALPAFASTTSDPRVDAFRDTCAPARQDYEGMVAHAAAQGWVATAGDEHPEFAYVLSIARSVPLDPGMTSGLTAFRREVDGRRLFLVASYLKSEAIDLVSCYLYDFEASATLSPDLFSSWLGEPPHRSIDDKTLVSHIWDTPKALPGTWDVYVGYAADGSAEARQIGFSGLAFRLTAVDPKDE